MQSARSVCGFAAHRFASFRVRACATHPCMFKSAYHSNQTGQSPRNAPLYYFGSRYKLFRLPNRGRNLRQPETATRAPTACLQAVPLH